MNAPGPVLIHARGRQTPDECAFWNRLDAALRAAGRPLVIIAHHEAKAPVAFDMRTVPNGFDSAEGDDPPSGSIGRVTIDELLERERLWWGPEGSERHTSRRQRGAEFFRAAYARWLDEWAPSLVVIWSGHHAQEIILAELARQRGVPLAWIERGPLPRTLHFDRLGVLGGSSVAHQSSWSWRSPDERRHWRDVLDRFIGTLGDTTWWEQPDAVGPAAFRERLGIRQDQTVACFAGQVDRDAQNFFFSPTFANNAAALKWMCRQLPGPCFLLGKHHPKSATPSDEYARFLADRLGAWVTDAALSDCIAACDRFVAVNSTSLFEAMLAGKPSLMLGQGLLSNKAIAYNADEVQDWLAGADWTERARRFRDFAAHLLADHLFAADEANEQRGLRGVEHLARTLVSWSQTPHLERASA